MRAPAVRGAMRTLAGAAGLALGAVAVSSGVGAVPSVPAALFPTAEVRAQEAPPAPLPAEEFRLPSFQERTLANGSRLLVAPQREMPFVTVHLVFPAGRTMDPAQRVGLADLTARLLLRGTATRTAREIEEALDFLGAELEASASSDWTTVSAGVMTPDLPRVLELMADAVLHPTFPVEELEELRRRKLQALEAELESPAGLADRAFLRAVYGDHPYGNLETPETVGALDRASVLDFHRTWYRPGEALFVVSGDVEAGRAADLVEEAFAEWGPGDPPEIDWGLPPLRRAPRVVLVHRPGADRAALRVGHTVMRGDHPDWTALVTLAEVLGRSPDGLLSRILREERDPSAAAWVRTERRLDRGFFGISAESRTEEAATVLEELYTQLLRLREEPVSLAELRDARGFLVGAWPLRFETPRQIASQLTAARVLGIPDSALATHQRRVAGLGAGDLLDVAAARIQPGELVFVVVGDAARLHGALTGFGEVSVVDARDDPVALTALVPGERSERLDASGLRPGRLEYRVTFEGRLVGRAVRTLEAGALPATMIFRGTADVSAESVSQSVTFTVPDFEVVAAEARLASDGDTASMDVRVREGRVVGTVRGPGGVTERIDRPLPRGALVGDMVELVPRVVELWEGKDLVVPVAQVTTGVTRNVSYRVTGAEEVTVPAGTFPAFRVEIGGVEAQTVWVRRAPPHVPLRIRPDGGPVVLELLPGALPGPGL